VLEARTIYHSTGKISRFTKVRDDASPALTLEQAQALVHASTEPVRQLRAAAIKELKI